MPPSDSQPPGTYLPPGEVPSPSGGGLGCTAAEGWCGGGAEDFDFEASPGNGKAPMPGIIRGSGRRGTASEIVFAAALLGASPGSVGGLLRVSPATTSCCCSGAVAPLAAAAGWWRHGGTGLVSARARGWRVGWRGSLGSDPPVPLVARGGGDMGARSVTTAGGDFAGAVAVRCGGGLRGTAAAASIVGGALECHAFVSGWCGLGCTAAAANAVVAWWRVAVLGGCCA